MTNASQSGDPILCERAGTVAILTPTPVATAFAELELGKVSQQVLAFLQAQPLSGIVMDLSKVDFFGSIFISFMLRCHTTAKKQQGRMVLASVGGNTRDMLHLTALDSVWPMYNDRAAALQALSPAK